MEERDKIELTDSENEEELTIKELDDAYTLVRSIESDAHSLRELFDDSDGPLSAAATQIERKTLSLRKALLAARIETENDSTVTESQQSEK